MATNINRLLKKKGWTGKEIGKALILSLIHDFKQAGTGKHTPLFEQGDFDKMVSSLSNEKDFAVYNVYFVLYNALHSNYIRSQLYLQQFYHGYFRFFNYIMLCHRTDMALAEAARHPFIMTQQQYDRLFNSSKEKLREQKESFNSVLFYTLEDFIDNPGKAPAPVSAAIEATKGQFATNQRILADYNDYTGQGYYELKDGSRSDQMTDQEWQTAKKKAFVAHYEAMYGQKPKNTESAIILHANKQIKKMQNYFFNGVDAMRKDYREGTGKEFPVTKEQEALQLEAIEEMAEGIGRMKHSEIMELLTEADKELYLIGGKWHNYEDPATGKTKYDLLAHCIERYNGLDTEDGADEKEQLKEFKADYPELYKALTAYIKETIPQAKDLKANQYGKEFITWGELADIGYSNYKSLTEPDNDTIAQEFIDEDTTENFIKRQRIVFGGISIMQSPAPDSVDENGDYIGRGTVDVLNNFFTLDEMAECEELMQEIASLATKFQAPALAYIYAFNELLKIFADIYDVEELQSMAVNTSGIEGSIKTANELIKAFYMGVFGTREDKKRKREIIKAVYPIINAEELKPTKEAIEKVRQELEVTPFTSGNIKKIDNFNSLIAMLKSEG